MLSKYQNFAIFLTFLDVSVLKILSQIQIIEFNFKTSNILNVNESHSSILLVFF